MPPLQMVTHLWHLIHNSSPLIIIIVVIFDARDLNFLCKNSIYNANISGINE